MKVVFSSKEDLCSYINNIYIKRRNQYFEWEEIYFENIEFRIPIYESEFKKRILYPIRVYLHRGYFRIYKKLPKISWIDCSKYIKPDRWEYYQKEKICLKALPNFVDDFEHFWVISIVPEFYSLDLEFGINPISIISNTRLDGGGPIIMDKLSGKTYEISNVDYFTNSIEKEYNKYLRNEKSRINWKRAEMKIEFKK